jgi:hypothetical protein
MSVMRSWLCVAALVATATTTVALAGCGGRLVPERRLLPDGAVAPEYEDGGADGETAGERAASDAATDACSELPAPRCVPTSTCGQMYLYYGEGLVEGSFHFETVDVPCQSPPTVVQQWLNGEWVVLPSLPNEAIPGTTSPDTYIIGSQYPYKSPQEGATVGSLQAIRGCTVSGACTTCDPPTSIKVLQCGACLPQKCETGKYLDENCQCERGVCPCARDEYPVCMTPKTQC